MQAALEHSVMVLRVFNVAEKPSAAREIVAVLRQGQQSHSRPGRSRYNQIYEFDMNLGGRHARMIFTSVSGHLKDSDFEERVRKWGTCDPADLLDPSRTAVRWFVHEDKMPLAQTLRTESRSADWLILWLDCDSEGEKIAYDVADVCKQGKPNIVVKRARFSAMTPADLLRAISHLDQLNERVAEMVSTRQEIDLRAGSAYTRFLTKQLEKFALVGEDERQLISYGPCQFPTLGLVVDRWLRIQNFVSRPFWVFDLALFDCKVPFDWARKHIFDEVTAMALYELCIEEAEQEGMLASVMRVDKRIRNRWRPLPLSTVELQKIASRTLRINSHRTMEIAEALYNKGLISYPRTETDRFDKSYNLRELVGKQTEHPGWGQFASRLLSPASQADAVSFTWPRAGKNDDKAHPPIHPTEAAPQSFDSAEHRRVYEYITKRFLASCSIDARGAETRVEVRAGVSELFSARGLIVEERGYLEVLDPFEKWSEKDMPVALLSVNAKIHIQSLTVRQSRTQPPPLLQESDLIALMDHHGIGTDATIAEHIKKVLDRQYVEKVGGGGFSPTQIGQALVIAHERCQLHLARPQMRANQEEQLKRILTSGLDASEVLANALSEYSAKFNHLRQNRNIIDVVFQDRFRAATAESWSVLISGFVSCGNCRQVMDLKGSDSGGLAPSRGRGPGPSSAGTRGRSRGRGRGRGHPSIRREGADRAVHCSSCERTLKVPRNGALEAATTECPICRYQVVTVTNTTSNAQHTVCPKCFNDPPSEAAMNPEGKTSEFRCFSCTNAACPLARGTPAGHGDVAKCPKCGEPCALREGRDGNSRFVACSARECGWVYFFPRGAVQSLTPEGGTCPTCGSSLLNVLLRRSAIPPGFASTFRGCIWCDDAYKQLLIGMGEERDIPRSPHPGAPATRGRGGRGGRSTFGRTLSEDIEDGGRAYNSEAQNRRRGRQFSSQYPRGRGQSRARYSR